LWSDDLGPQLSGAVDDLQGQNRVYLMARLGRHTPIELLSSLPPTSLASVLLAQGRGVLERYAPEAVIKLIEASGPAAAHPNLIGVQLEALYRTGRWPNIRESVAEFNAPLSPVIDALRAGQFERVRAIDDSAGHPARFLLRWATRDWRADPVLSTVQDGFFRWAAALVESLSSSETFWDFATFACAASQRSGSARNAADVLEAAGKLCERAKRLPAGANDGGALRVLAIFDGSSGARILRRVDFASHFATISAIELRAFGSLIGQAQRTSGFRDSDVLALASEFFQQHGSATERTVIADPTITHQLARIVTELVEAGTPDTNRQVRTILAMTHPDWIEPLGAALTRAFNGAVPSRLGWWSSIDRYLGSSGHERRLSPDSNGEEILSLADEAGSLAEAVVAYRELLGANTSPASRDFITLAERFQQWSELLRRTVGAAPEALVM
jgi:hypothetical protein